MLYSQMFSAGKLTLGHQPKQATEELSETTDILLSMDILIVPATTLIDN